MSKRQKRWAKCERARLIFILGGCCANCGKQSDLEFDCISPTGHDHHTGSTDQRMCFYRKQYAIGNLQVLCGKCNAIKGDEKNFDGSLSAQLPLVVDVCTFKGRPIVTTYTSEAPF